CSHSERNPVGAAMDDPYAPVIDTESIGTDLCQHRLEPLADRSRAADNFDQAGGIDRDSRGFERPKPAFLDEERKPRPDAFPSRAPAFELFVQLVPASSAQRLVEQSRIVAGVEHDICAES